MEKYVIKKFNKFLKLNFNLKNEIFEFIPIDQTLTELILTNKPFSNAIFSKNHFKYIKSSYVDLTRKVNFISDRINDIKNEFANLNLPENFNWI
jgi:hypothetical protein